MPNGAGEVSGAKPLGVSRFSAAKKESWKTAESFHSGGRCADVVAAGAWQPAQPTLIPRGQRRACGGGERVATDGKWRA